MSDSAYPNKERRVKPHGPALWGNALRKRLNAVIRRHARKRGCRMPLIGNGHAEFPGGILILLQDPGNSGPEKTGFVDIDNPDPTAQWTRELLEELGIPKAAITPWNALGAFGDKAMKRGAAVRLNKPLCQEIISIAKPAAILAQGKSATDMIFQLSPAIPTFLTPHPSRLGRANRPGAKKYIEGAYLLCNYPVGFCVLRRGASSGRLSGRW